MQLSFSKHLINVIYYNAPVTDQEEDLIKSQMFKINCVLSSVRALESTSKFFLLVLTTYRMSRDWVWKAKREHVTCGKITCFPSW